MKKYITEYLKAAHKHSIFHKKEIMESELCGCFNCLRTFTPDEIFYWIDQENPKGSTAMCPYCNIDSVIDSKSGFPGRYKENDFIINSSIEIDKYVNLDPLLLY